MAAAYPFLSVLVLLCLTLTAVSTPISQRQSSLYAPVKSSCPSTALVRSAAKGLSELECSYSAARKTVADAALKKWLHKVCPEFKTRDLPSIGLTTSGGGLRSLLEGAGVVQALDSRDSNYTVSGLYQALTYHAGISGGSWLVGSLAGNNWPTISSLKTGLWETTFAASLPPQSVALQIIGDILAKNAAGFSPTLADPYGRVLSFDLLIGSDGAVTDTLSGITSKSQFISHAVPYPIVTAILAAPGQCIPDPTSPQFELHPYEFGSWDTGIAAFTQTAYLGTDMTNGKPTTANQCIKNYDNLGYAMGTSSDTFSLTCQTIPSKNSSDASLAALETLLSFAHPGSFRDEFAVYPNPFHSYSGSPAVQSLKELNLVDGGFSAQQDPIWPFIQPARKPVVDVLIVNDNGANTADNFPNGTDIYVTYLRAKQVGLRSMPDIPPPATFVSKGLNKRATFFGCNDDDKLTIIYLPNVAYSYPSNQPTFRVVYPPADTEGMIANGVQIATQNGDAQWPTCLACALVKKSQKHLPSACRACFKKYCYSGNNY